MSYILVTCSFAEDLNANFIKKQLKVVLLNMFLLPVIMIFDLQNIHKKINIHIRRNKCSCYTCTMYIIHIITS